MADPFVEWDNSVAGLYTGTLRGHTIRIQRVQGEPKPYHVYVNDVLQGSKHTIREAQTWAIRITHRQEFRTAERDLDTKPKSALAQELSSTTSVVLTPDQRSEADDLRGLMRAGTNDLKSKLTTAWEKDPSSARYKRDVWSCVHNDTLLMIARKHGHTDWEAYTEHAFLGIASTKAAAETRCLKAIGWVDDHSRNPEPATATATTATATATTTTTATEGNPTKMDSKIYQRIHPKTDYASFGALLGKACAVLGAEPEEVVEMIGYAAPANVLRNWAAERKVPVTTYWAMVGLLGEGTAPEVDTTGIREVRAEATKEYLQVPVPVFSREQLLDIIQVFSGDQFTDEDIIIAAAKGLVLERNTNLLEG